MGTATKHAASTIVLVGDLELVLHVAPSVLTFAQWGVETSSCTPVAVTISLQTRENGDSSADASSDAPPCVPLVITPPLTARFRLEDTGDGSDLLPLLDVGSRRSTTLRVAFVPPSPTDSDDLWDNFHDQIVIQSRLSRLTVRLEAMRHASRRDDCAADSFRPQSLIPVKAPPLRLFDEIERRPRRSSTATRRVRVLEPVNPSLVPSLSALESSVGSSVPQRPTSRGRTSSPRLDPLPPAGSTSSVSISSDAEARAVILRLRAKRSTLQSVCDVNTSSNSNSHAAPESRSEPPSATAVETFHEIVHSAKSSVALAMQRAKVELAVPVIPPMEPVIARPPSASNAAAVEPVSRGLPRKPVKPPPTLPTIERPHRDSRGNQDQPLPSSEVTSSGGRGRLKKANNAPTIKSEHRQHAPLRPPKELTTRTLESKERRAIRENPTKTAMSRKTKATAKQQNDEEEDDALRGFEDSEPEIDDAPVVPDDLHSTLRALEEEDEAFVL
ncbi:hypothetical protein PINS_up005521 [Pythium insidiosum]|nr:hypothetical protein PINS_up005521 [Pythium insidiosum]